MFYLVDLYVADWSSYNTLEELKKEIRDDPDSFGAPIRYALFSGQEINVDLVFREVLAKPQIKEV